jgi:hypothetical protein
MFRPFVNGSDESEWDDVAGESCYPINLLPHRLLSAQSSSLFSLCEVNWFSCLCVETCLQSFNVFYVAMNFTKNKFSHFKIFLRLFYVLLLLFHKSLELKKNFTIKVASWFRCFYGSVGLNHHHQTVLSVCWSMSVGVRRIFQSIKLARHCVFNF